MTRQLGFVIFPDFQILDATGPLAAFEIAARYVPGTYELRIMAAEPGLVRSSCGALMSAGPLEGPLDTVIVSGGEGTRPAALHPVLIAWLRALTPRRTTSVCSGAYILAEAGLLDGKRATTHWERTQDFARRYPKVRLEPDRIYTRDGDVWTSAGITAGIDLALALIAQDLGEDIARRVAQQLVVYHRRPGGQSQFSALIEMGGRAGRFAELLDWMRPRLAEPLTVERLADQAAMSARNFARASAAETGMTPAKAVERLRLETARERVEGSADPIDRIAETAGFGDPERMRRAFIRAFGQPPQALRRTARS
ncbi:GlxA family transcriptional regulator [Phenylobacterium aquaticum]|uniref:GlxA family transcriptional regulator n=1 Tax=Phenylobacterium aquaticum TaxID=1763816 RepID=UPI0026F104B6|nr:GlxA family transcriptional regulator [Phenylobacterium aquaticum]